MTKSKKENKSAKIDQMINDLTQTYRETGESTDPLGMYTGVVSMPDTVAPTNAVDGGKVYQKVEMHPQQDADDL